MNKVSLFSQEDFESGNQEKWASGITALALTRAAANDFDTVIMTPRRGPELEMAETILEKADLDLIVVLPYENYGIVYKEWSKEDRARLGSVLDRCKEVVYADEWMYRNKRRSSWDKGVHSWGKVGEAAELIVDLGDAAIFSYGGRAWGTTYLAFAYARENEKPVYWINPVMKQAKWINN